MGRWVVGVPFLLEDPDFVSGLIFNLEVAVNEGSDSVSGVSLVSLEVNASATIPPSSTDFSRRTVPASISFDSKLSVSVPQVLVIVARSPSVSPLSYEVGPSDWNSLPPFDLGLGIVPCVVKFLDCVFELLRFRLNVIEFGVFCGVDLSHSIVTSFLIFRKFFKY